MIIVLDTNILIRYCFKNKWINSSKFKLLKKFVDIKKETDEKVSILIPKIVFQEVLKKYKEKINEAKNNLDKTKKNCEDLDLVCIFPNLDIDKLLKCYNNNLKNDLSTIAEISQTHTSIQHDNIVNKLIEGKKPFTSDGKKGYRDALIWFSIIDL